MHAYWIFLLKKIAEAIFLSPLLPFIMIAHGLLSLHWRPRRGLLYCWSGLLILLFFSTPVTVDWVAKGLENFPPVTTKQLKTAQAIVILGGGERGYAREYGGPVPDRVTLERLRYAARLAKESGLPVLVSGGAPRGMQPEATLMAQSLRQDFGIQTRWLEQQSLDTADNAYFSAQILKDAGIARIALVTTALHMRRAVFAFRHEGLSVIPAPTAFISDEPPEKMITDYLPGAASADDGWAVVHEWVGILVQQVEYRVMPKGFP